MARVIPPLNTDEGVMAHVFFLQLSPGGDLAEATKAMRQMRSVLFNRSRYPRPREFGAKSASLAEIVGAPKQFPHMQRVGGTLQLTESGAAHIKEFSAKLAAGDAKYVALFDAGVAIWTPPNPRPPDWPVDEFGSQTQVGPVPVIGGLYGWQPKREEGLGRFVRVPGSAAAGLTFFTLRRATTRPGPEVKPGSPATSSFVEKIPDILRDYGKKQGLDMTIPVLLLKRWKEAPAHQKNPDVPGFEFTDRMALPSETGITWEWILDEDTAMNRRAENMLKLLRQSLRITEAVKVLKRKGRELLIREKGERIPFGQLKLATPQDAKNLHEGWQFQLVSHENGLPILDPFDPLFAALGNFSFFASAKGFVQRKGPESGDLVVEEVGLYLLDSFDFNGSQRLGTWKEPDDISLFAITGSRVTNETFRTFREEHPDPKKGGDFTLASDLKVLRYTFTVPIP